MSVSYWKFIRYCCISLYRADYIKTLQTIQLTGFSPFRNTCSYSILSG
uniref:Bradykinin n=1 Tax=Podoviridae sp. ctBev14 TaxID=2823556 RepID=A0A8S5LAS9_9CAUD|nr:MAG TPA: Bradykinin [Podoviridae sp. ctBev14]